MVALLIPCHNGPPKLICYVFLNYVCTDSGLFLSVLLSLRPSEDIFSAVAEGMCMDVFRIQPAGLSSRVVGSNCSELAVADEQHVGMMTQVS